MRVREATEADRARVLEMALHFFATTAYGAMFHGIDAGLDDLVTLTLAAGAIFVAEEPDGRLEGFLAIVKLTHPITKQPFGDELAWWVEPTCRLEGTGELLLHHMHDWARREGLHLVKMVAPAHSGIGLIYERHGYAQVETAYARRL